MASILWGINFSITALIFQHMKSEIDSYVEKYGQSDNPPPWQMFTIANEVREGNLHLVQKVFDGAFEVCPSWQEPLPLLIQDLV